MSTCALPTGIGCGSCLALDAGHGSARIADGAGAVDGERRRHHVSEFVFIFRRHQHHLGNTAEIADVEQTVVCWAVVAGEAGAIHAENHGKLLQGDVMHDGIEGALQESGVDGAERAISRA